MADGAAVFMPAIGLGEQDLLRALRRLHADLAELLEGPGDGRGSDGTQRQGELDAGGLG